MSLQTSAKRSSGGGSDGSSSSKPRLTLAQTKEEVENGNLAPEVVRAYAYYYGLDEETALAALEGAKEEEVALLPEATRAAERRKLEEQLERLETSKNGEAKILSAIESAYKAGRITEEEANGYMRRYGFGG